MIINKRPDFVRAETLQRGDRIVYRNLTWTVMSVSFPGRGRVLLSCSHPKAKRIEIPTAKSSTIQLAWWVPAQ
jgi:hypothetical protein